MDLVVVQFRLRSADETGEAIRLIAKCTPKSSQCSSAAVLSEIVHNPNRWTGTEGPN